ncbi:MAG: radical SAM protein [Candidatus Lokiarchaeota archaeon]|nr:radical SAM protein [Candidatus Lokiarchaeota archaeon]
MDEQSEIPLFGLDFMGILDRGTNLLEIKPITVCNLRCKYCFVNAHFGNTPMKSDTSSEKSNTFMIQTDYIIKWLKIALKYKKCNDTEVHIAPYGEIFLYPDYLDLFQKITRLPQVKTLSIQTNGTLLTEKIIDKLEKVGVTRLNISLNTLNEKKASILSGIPHYDVSHLLRTMHYIKSSSIDLLIAPIWFFKYNDEDIKQIIELAQDLVKDGYDPPTPLLGIQNYLIYKTGRKFWKVQPHSFDYFYKRLSQLENKYNIKLKIGPLDFDIHPAEPISAPVEFGTKISVKILCLGRSKNEYIGSLNDMWAVKVLSKIPLAPQKIISVTVIKQKPNENLITATYSGTF